MIDLAEKFKNILEVLYILPKRKIVVTIGDEGAIVFLIDKNTIQDRLFTKSPNPLEDKICSLFAKNKKVPICIFLDNIDQQFKVQEIPAINILSLQQLLKHRLDKVLSGHELKKAIYLYKSGKSKLEYVFAGVRLTENIRHWLDYIKSLPNSISFISMLPIEYCLLAKKLEPGNTKQEHQDRWKIIVTENKVSGFRQVVLRSNKIILTRLVEESKEGLTDIVAGNIHQELINITLYLGRLKYEQDKHQLEVYVIVSKEIKHSLSAMKLKVENVKILTPYEASEILQIAHIAKPENKFADVILSYFAAKSGPVAKFLLSDIKKSLVLGYLDKALSFCSVILFVLFLGYSAGNLVSVFMKKREYASLRESLVRTQNELARLKDNFQEHDYDYTKIAGIKEVYSEILEHSQKGQQLTTMLKKLKELSEIMSIKNIYWKFRGGTIELEIDGSVTSSSSKYSELFASYKELKNTLYTAFSDCTIKLSDLPRNITSDRGLKDLSINIEISKQYENIIR